MVLPKDAPRRVIGWSSSSANGSMGWCSESRRKSPIGSVSVGRNCDRSRWLPWTGPQHDPSPVLLASLQGSNQRRRGRGAAGGRRLLPSGVGRGPPFSSCRYRWKILFHDVFPSLFQYGCVQRRAFYGRFCDFEQTSQWDSFRHKEISNHKTLGLVLFSFFVVAWHTDRNPPQRAGCTTVWEARRTVGGDCCG